MNRSKYYATLILTLMLTVSAWAQTNIVETYHLKNGSVITGYLIEYVPGKEYKLKTTDGSVVVFEYEDIVKVTRSEEANAKPAKQKGNITVDHFQTKYQTIIELGTGVGVNTYGVDIFKVDLIYGKRLSEQLFVGGGLILRQPMPNEDMTFMGAVANIRYNLTPREVTTPYASLSIGGSFNNVEGIDDGGAVVNPSIGIYVTKFDFGLINLSIGYDAMHMPFFIPRTSWPFGIEKRIRFSEAAVFHVGVTF